MTTATDLEIIEIDVTQIQPNPWQTRETINDDGIQELANSIARDGLLQPIIVRKVRPNLYELVAGQRRLLAWELLMQRGTFKPTDGIPAIVRNVSDRQMVLDTLTENLVREDVDPVEEARAMQRALEQVDELTQADLAATVQTSPSNLSNRLRLLKLPPEALKLVSEGRMAWTTARELLRLENKQHSHDDKIVEVLGTLPQSIIGGIDLKQTPITAGVMQDTIVTSLSNWRAIDFPEDRHKEKAWHRVWDKKPEFDVEAWAVEWAETIHKVAFNGKTYRFTCAAKMWDRAQREAKKAAPPERDDQRERWAAIMAKDPVAKRLGLTKEKFSYENLLTKEQVNALGTRGQYKRTSHDQVISGQEWNRAPEYFDKSECVDTCTKGAHYAAEWFMGGISLRCSNEPCYELKIEEGVARLKKKADKRLKIEDGQIRNRAAQMVRVLRDYPTLAETVMMLALKGNGRKPVRLDVKATEWDAPTTHRATAMEVAGGLGLAPLARTERQPLWHEEDAFKALVNYEGSAEEFQELAALAFALHITESESGHARR